LHREPSTSNTLYLATDALTINGRSTGHSGAGYFPAFAEELTLTARDATTTSEWDLPGWMLPTAGKPTLSYHASPERWGSAGDRARLSSVARGQEFVLDSRHYPRADSWAEALIAQGTS
jgi:hypothetical protein